MSETKYTPGPWQVVSSLGARSRPLICAGDKPIAELSIAWGNDADANAILIAAAPTLLAAAKDALQILQAVQAENETNPDAMPWPEIDNLEQIIRVIELA